MKILTCNFKQISDNASHGSHTQLQQLILDHDVDIVVLTNTYLQFDLGNAFKKVATTVMPLKHDGIVYKAGQNSVSIYTKYPLKNKVKTYDRYTSVCQMIETPLGNLNFYGTIIGTRMELFESDFVEQKEDLIRIEGALCYIGDFNTSFTSTTSIQNQNAGAVIEFLNHQKMNLLTALLADTTQHIAISNSFLKGTTTQIIYPTEDTALLLTETILVEIKEKEIKKQVNNPLHGIKLSYMLEKLVDHYGWDELGDRIRINSFNSNPGIKSSLKFLRKTDWARKKVEDLYLSTFVK
jgi:hypothetical protein